MAAEDTPPPSRPPRSGPGTHPSAPRQVTELPYAEELQTLLGGAYIVESFLGQGGMGAVYKGLQMPLKRPVAIKILAKRGDGVEDDFAFEERFKREAYAMAALTHPHIVQVYDCGDAGENFLFISMELVEGGDLSDAIKDAKVTPEVALKLIPQICEGLQAAHERGIVHRDIKPANIFLTHDGRAKVADFGLAKKFDVKGTLLTKTGLGMGTPDYAAPEQYEAVTDIDHRADIYALGVMMYHMLTGRLPRGASCKTPSQIVRVDPRIDAIVAKAMASERAERYQSATEIKAALAHIAANPVPVVATAVRSEGATAAGRPSTGGRPTSQPVKRPTGMNAPVPVAVLLPEKKKLNLVAIGSIAAVVIGLGAMFLLRGGNQPEPTSPGAKVVQTAPSIPAKAASSAAGKPGLSKPSSLSPSSEPWQDMLHQPVQLRLEKGAVVRADGLSLPEASSATVNNTAKATNGAVRALINASGTFQKGGEVMLRARYTGGKSAYLLQWASPSTLTLARIVGSKTTLLKTFNTSTALKQGQDCDMELRAVGSKLTVKLNGIDLGSVQDSELAGGEFGIASYRPTDVLVKALEYLPLAETTGATMAVTPSPAPVKPTNPTSPSFPPGQWVKLFTKVEDLPEKLRKADSGVEWKDGAISATQPTSLPMGTSGLIMRNGGWRATFSKGATYEMRLRDMAQTFYALWLGSLVYSEGGTAARTFVPLAKFPSPSSSSTEHQCEIVAVGTRLYARRDGALICIVQDNRRRDGQMVPNNLVGTVRGIEVINLDGIPESEALRILGVDEKGNDLRALAVVQEKARQKQQAIAAIAELAPLHEQFHKLRAERVTAPFEEELAKLGAGYLGGLDREIDNEKKAGHLDGVLALGAEKRLIADKQPVSPMDDDKTPDSLVKLRAIYRGSHAMLVTQQAANLKALTDPLAIRLATLEAEFTKSDRIADAKVVREYREELAGGSAGIPNGNDPSPPQDGEKPQTDKGVSTPSSNAPKAKVNRELSRKAAEYALSKGAKVTVEQNDKMTEVKPGDALPKGTWDLWGVRFPDKGTLTDEDVQAVCQAVELKQFRSGEQGRYTVTSLLPFRNTPHLALLIMQGLGEISRAECEVLAGLAALEELRVPGTKPIADLGFVLGRSKVNHLELSGRPLSAADCDALNRHSNLKWLNLGGTPTDELIAKLDGMMILEQLHAPLATITGAGLQSLNSKLSKTLKVLALGSAAQDSSSTVTMAIEKFPLLEELHVRGEVSASSFAQLHRLERLKKVSFLQTALSLQHISALSECGTMVELRLGRGRITSADVSALERLKNLRILTFHDNGITLDADALSAMADIKTLTQLDLPQSQVTPDAAAKLRKQIPGCKITLVPRYD